MTQNPRKLSKADRAANRRTAKLMETAGMLLAAQALLSFIAPMVRKATRPVSLALFSTKKPRPRKKEKRR